MLLQKPQFRNKRKLNQPGMDGPAVRIHHSLLFLRFHPFLHMVTAWDGIVNQAMLEDVTVSKRVPVVYIAISFSRPFSLNGFLPLSFT